MHKLKIIIIQHNRNIVKIKISLIMIIFIKIKINIRLFQNHYLRIQIKMMKYKEIIYKVEQIISIIN